MAQSKSRQRRPVRSGAAPAPRPTGRATTVAQATRRPTDSAAPRGRAAAQTPPDPPDTLSPWIWRVSLVLCLIGLADASYLTAAHYTTAVTLVCSGHGVINCEKVTTSPQSIIAGIPVAVLGLAYFVGMLPLQLPAMWASRNAWILRARLAGVITGIGMVAYLVYTEVFTLHAICLYCTGVHVVTLLLFITVMIGTALAPRDGESA